MAESLEKSTATGAGTTAGPVNHVSAVRPSQLAPGASSPASAGTTVPVPSAAAGVINAPSGGAGTNNSATGSGNPSAPNPQPSSVAASTCKGKGGAAGLASQSGSPSVAASTHPVAVGSYRRSSAATSSLAQPINSSSPPPYSWVQHSCHPQSSASVAGSSFPLDEPDQAIEGAGYNWSARNQATWSGPVPLLVRRVSASGGGGSGCARYGSLNRRTSSRQQPPSSSLRLVNGGLANPQSYPSSDEELRSPHHRRLYQQQQQQQPLLSGLNRNNNDDYYGHVVAGGSGGGGSYSYGGVRTCSDSLVTALEDEASTSSFVPDYLVAGADEMNFINKDNVQQQTGGSGGGAGTTSSTAGSYAAGRVHFSNSAAGAGGDDVSLYGTPKEEAGPGPGPANMGGEPKPSFIRALFQPTDNKLAMKLFGSKKALMKERMRQKAAGHWIIHPCSNFR